MKHENLTAQLNMELAQKTAQELQEFENTLLRQSKEQIMAQAVKLAIIRQFQRLFAEKEFSLQEAQLISTVSYPLAELYEEWLAQNSDPADALRDILSSYIVKLRNDRER